MRFDIAKRGEGLTYEIRNIVGVANRLKSCGMEVTWENIGDLLTETSVLFMMALAQMVVILTRGIDLLGDVRASLTGHLVELGLEAVIGLLGEVGRLGGGLGHRVLLT